MGRECGDVERREGCSEFRLCETGKELMDL